MGMIMGMIMMVFEAVPEPGRLALMGMGLIVIAFVLRRVLTRVPPALDTPAKSDPGAN